MSSAHSDRSLNKYFLPELLVDSILRADRPGLPKHIQLRDGVVSLIERSLLKVGDQILPEQQLAVAVRMSLGTVQKALNRLAIEGWVIREHGRGTFVADPHRSIKQVWHDRFLDHFRFLDPASGQLLPVYSKLLHRRVILDPLAPKSFLGEDSKGFVEIGREIDVDQKFVCYSRMYLRASGFRRLLDLPAHAFENVNLKELFVEHFGAQTASLTERIKVHRFSGEAAKVVGVSPGTVGLQFIISATTWGERPLSFQEIDIPPSRYFLDLSKDPSVRG
jgi:GntR family transcriptional regulator